VYALEAVLLVLETVTKGPLLPQTLYKCFELCEVMLRQRYEHEHKADVCHALLSIVENPDGNFPLIVAKRAANTLVTLCCGCTADWKQQFLVRATDVLQQLPQELQDILHFVTDDAPPVKPEPVSSSAQSRSNTARNSSARLGSPPGRPAASMLSPQGGPMSPYEQQKLQQQQHNEEYHRQQQQQQQQQSPYERRSRAATVFPPRPTAMSAALQRNGATANGYGSAGRPELRSPAAAARGSVRSAAAVKAEPAAPVSVSVKSERNSGSSYAPLPVQPPPPADDSDEEEGAVTDTQHRAASVAAAAAITAGVTAAAAAVPSTPAAAVPTTAAAAAPAVATTSNTAATGTTAAGATASTAASTTAGTAGTAVAAVPTTAAVLLATSAPAASSSSSIGGVAVAAVRTAPVLTTAPAAAVVATHGNGLHQQVQVY
jgi:hypothetical protein